MLNVRLTRAILFILLLLPIIGVTGCSVFGTVGGWISQGYENTVAYFNAYYNAKTLFDEAEAEVIAAQLAAKGKSTQTGTPAAPVAIPKQKFATVIDKCSAILAFSPTSNVVDDALFLIGKSFYYQEDYVKAERKFTELIAQYPKSDLALDGELWLLKTLSNLKRYDDAKKVGRSLADTAAAAGESAIAANALATLGDISVAQGQYDLGLDHYRSAVEQADDDKTKSDYAVKSADLLFSLEQYEKAAESYLLVEQLSAPVNTLYYSQLQAAICYRLVAKFDHALATLEKIEADYRFLENRGAVRLERAEILSQAGRMPEALEAYKLVDSLYYRTEIGAKGAMKLAALLQYDLDDYAGAKFAYDRAAAAGPQDQVQLAQRKSAALGRYFTLWKEYGKADSILTYYEVDSVWIARDSTGAPIIVETAADSAKRRPEAAKLDTAKFKPDSLKQAASFAAAPGDSSKRTADSTRSAVTKEPAPPVSTSPKYRTIPRPDRNTTAAARASASFQLGELFHADLDSPDSTYFWLNRSIHFELDSVKAPRALYLMAGIANADSLKRFGDGKELYRFILGIYPKSAVAQESRVALGFPAEIKVTDLARRRFFAAESLYHTGQFQKAVDSLSVLARETSDSTYLPKSLYTLAWIYEHNLNQPDSAISKYRTLATRFEATTYGAVAVRRVPPPPEPPAADSSKAKTVGAGKTAPSAGAASSVSDSTLKSRGAAGGMAGPDSTMANTVRPKVAPDTTGLSTLLKKAPADSTVKAPEFDDPERIRTRRDSTRSRRAKEIEEKY
jgi:tetratricopeptide (TPR) repeat protein